jgi:flagellar M-ring protein FliF
VDGNVTPRVSDSIQQAVSVAAGLDPARGDQVTVESLPFDTSAAQAQDRAMAQESTRETRSSYIKWGATVLLALAFLFFLRSVLASWRPMEVTEHFPRPLPLHEAESLTGGALDLRSDEPSLAPAGTPAETHAEPAPIPARRPGDIAREHPEGVARLLRTWLTEGE